MIRILIAAAVCAAAAAAPASACSCACAKDGPESTAQGWIERADYLFRGTVASRAEDAETGAETYVMTPRIILKGEPAPNLTLRSPPSGGACGVGFQRGETRDVIAVKGPDGRLHVNICAQFCAGQAGAFKGLGPADK